MRQITTREKAFLAIGALGAVGIFVWFILLPMLQNGDSEQTSSLRDMRKKLEALQNLANTGTMLVDLEENMEKRSGYGAASFKRGSANPAIINYIAQAADKAGIRDGLEQLDARPDTSRKTKTEPLSERDILSSLVDQMYMQQALDDVERYAIADAESIDEGNPDDEQSDSDESAEEPGDTESDKKEEPADSGEVVENTEQVKSEKSWFPPVPRDTPAEVRKMFAAAVTERQGKTLSLAGIDEILDGAGIEDEDEIKRVSNWLKRHSERVKEKKSEMIDWLGNVGVSQGASSQRVSKYAIKMVFKSQMDQLVKFLHDLQDSAKWLKVESMRIGISDRKQTVLSVELAMTATVLYGI